MTGRLSGRTWNAMSAWTVRPTLARLTSAWNPASTPRSRSSRVRTWQLDAAMPIRAASSRLLSRAFDCSSRTIAESTSSTFTPSAVFLDDVRLLSSLRRELSSIARVDRSYASGGDVRLDTRLVLEDYLALQ